MFSQAVVFVGLVLVAGTIHQVDAQCGACTDNNCVCCGRLGTNIPPGACVPIGASIVGSAGSHSQVTCGYCTGNSGKPTPQAGAACTTGLCPEPVPCCARQPTGLFTEGGGQCREDFTADICQGNAGVPQDGQNSRPSAATCAEANCPQSVTCCGQSVTTNFPDGLGQCRDVLTSDICTGSSGSILDENADCDAASCPQPVLCCGRTNAAGQVANGLGAGDCRDDVTQTFCQGNSGRVLSLPVDTTECTTGAANPYDDPCPPAVACCPLFPMPNPLESDVCVDYLAPDLCIGNSGLPLDGKDGRAGPIMDCTGNPCTLQNLAKVDTPCCGTVDSIQPPQFPLNPDILAEQCHEVTAKYCLGNTGVPQDGQNGRPSAASCDDAICAAPSVQPSNMPSVMSSSQKMPKAGKGAKSSKAPSFPKSLSPKMSKSSSSKSPGNKPHW